MGKLKSRKGAAPRTPGERLFAWADGIFKTGRGPLTPRLVIVRPDRLQEIDAEPLIDDLGVEALVQAAAIFGRLANDDELVGFYVRGQPMGDVPFMQTRVGVEVGVAAYVATRSRSGEFWGHYFHSEPAAGRQTLTVRADLGADSFGFEDWADPLIYIDPELEDLLAQRGLPGAERWAPPSLRRAIFASARGSAPPPAAPRIEADAIPEPTAGDRLKAIEYPWETARLYDELDDEGPVQLGLQPFGVTLTALPANFEARPLASLLARGWVNEAQALHLATKLDGEPDLRAAYRLLVAANLPTLATLHASAYAADLARYRQDDALMLEIAGELVARLDAASEAAGGIDAWLDGWWPNDTARGDEVGTAAISSAAVAAFSRVMIAALRPFKMPAPADSPLGRALIGVIHVLRYILTRIGVPERPPLQLGERVADLAALVLGAVPSSDGEPRMARWQEIIQNRNTRTTAALMLRDYAAFHAAALYSAFTLMMARLWRVRALAGGPLEDWRPHEEPTAGLFTLPLHVLARHCVQRAALEPDVDRALGMLARARAVAGWDPHIAAIFDEARFRAARWDEALLADLAKETLAGGSLGAAAEYLRVAEHLGRRRDAVVARKRLSVLAGGTRHQWIAEIRIAFGRPQEIADLRRTKDMERGFTEAAADPAERAVFALYGVDPLATVAEYRRAIAAQREALEWAALVEEVRSEEASASPSGAELPRPEVPRTTFDGAMSRALAALRFRLDRPRVAGSPLKPALEAHARRAGELLATTDEAAAATWLAALGGDAGLVAALDAALGGEAQAEAHVRAALALADEALVTALAGRWLAGIYGRLHAAWPFLARANADGGQLWRRARALERAAACAADPAARGAVERDLSALLDATQAADPAAPPADPAARPADRVASPDASPAASPDASPAASPVGSSEEAAEPDDDDFAPMQLAARALDRSRRDLDTPEWAVAEGLRQVAFYNLARGKRDLKMLRGTRDDGAALWELRHRDGRHPVRVVYRQAPGGPQVVAILAKQDDAHQRRLLERIRTWS